jgi:hypothetical protein
MDMVKSFSVERGKLNYRAGFLKCKVLCQNNFRKAPGGLSPQAAKP